MRLSPPTGSPYGRASFLVVPELWSTSQRRCDGPQDGVRAHNIGTECRGRTCLERKATVRGHFSGTPKKTRILHIILRYTWGAYDMEKSRI